MSMSMYMYVYVYMYMYVHVCGIYDICVTYCILLVWICEAGFLRGQRFLSSLSLPRQGADDGERLWDGKKVRSPGLHREEMPKVAPAPQIGCLEYLLRFHLLGSTEACEDLLKQTRKFMQPLPKFLRQTEVLCA